jgi:hypothetical protein
MEIYTTDLITMAQESADKIKDKLIELNDIPISTGYIIEDECCNLKINICTKLNERLTIAFNSLVEEIALIEEEEKKENITHTPLSTELHDKLFKIINDL